ncbi:methyl-accepting chemotaxis protein [Mobiluncus sp.]|uniref:methyl-accepting chemotaxis protein n=1 Tax=Mobiluncus sp. TaxID=47293 RepID=UPI002A919452|nr:methyl-accepting chemotaxis protein [Mobiluncus sp.]MDY6076694.1 methyl-accepting chemotaxis protein [Mobiluncus sp.]
MKLSFLVKLAYTAVAVFGVLVLVGTILTQVEFKKMQSDVAAKTEQTTQAARVSTASANLTNYVQEYVTTLDQKWLDMYWDEVAANNKADAVQNLKDMGAPTEETALIEEGMVNSDNLINLETRAQRLILDSLGVAPGNMPEAVAGWQVDPADAALEPAAKQSLARDLIFGEEYNGEVTKIMTPINQGIDMMTQRLDSSETQASKSAYAALWLLTIVAILLVVVLIVLLTLFNETTAKPIQEFRRILESSDAKDLTVRLRPRGVLETQQLAETINTKNSGIAEVVSMLASSAVTLKNQTDAIGGSTQRANNDAQQAAVHAGNTATNANEVSASIATVAAASEQMGASIREISSNATNAAEVANNAMEVAARTTEIVGKLSESSQRIGEVIASITQIAEQTNLLALNATIEAARAGDAGKGFAVVAGEVKDLAAQTGTATSDISARVLSIQEDTASAEQALQEITDVISKINESQTVIAAAVEEQTATVNEISKSVQSAAEGSQSIAQDISTIADAAQNNSEELGNVANNMNAVLDISNQLTGIVGGFKIDDTASVADAGPAPAAEATPEA